MISELKNKI